jgi:hypothetical protein
LASVPSVLACVMVIITVEPELDLLGSLIICLSGGAPDPKIITDPDLSMDFDSQNYFVIIIIFLSQAYLSLDVDHLKDVLYKYSNLSSRRKRGLN